MEVDTILPCYACVWRNYSNLSRISLDVLPCDKQYAKRVHVREREITRRTSKLVLHTYVHTCMRACTRVYVCTYNPHDQRGRMQRGARTLTSEFRKWAQRAISIIKCWMCIWRWNCVFIRSHWSPQLWCVSIAADATRRCSQYWFDKTDISSDK